MKITVSVKPAAREDTIQKNIDGYRVTTKAPAEDGKANEAVRRIVAGYFGIAPSRVEILRGSTGRKKLIEIL